MIPTQEQVAAAIAAEVKAIKIEGNVVFFRMDKNGLWVKRSGFKEQHLSWADLLAAAEGQFSLWQTL